MTEGVAKGRNIVTEYFFVRSEQKLRGFLDLYLLERNTKVLNFCQSMKILGETLIRSTLVSRFGHCRFMPRRSSATDVSRFTLWHFMSAFP